MQLANRFQCYQNHSKPVAQNHLRLQLFFGIDLELSMLTGSIDGQPKKCCDMQSIRTALAGLLFLLQKLLLKALLNALKFQTCLLAFFSAAWPAGILMATRVIS
jgi:hypothetical protein